MIGGSSPFEPADIEAAFDLPIEGKGFFLTYLMNMINNQRVRIKLLLWGSIYMDDTTIHHFMNPNSKIQISLLSASDSQNLEKSGVADTSSTYLDRALLWFRKQSARIKGFFSSEGATDVSADDGQLSMLLRGIVDILMEYIGSPLVKKILEGMLDEKAASTETSQFLRTCKIPVLCSDSLDGILKLHVKAYSNQLLTRMTPLEKKNLEERVLHEEYHEMGEMFKSWPTRDTSLKLKLGLELGAAIKTPGITDDLKRLGITELLGLINIIDVIELFTAETKHILSANVKAAVRKNVAAVEVGYPEPPYTGANIPNWSVWSRELNKSPSKRNKKKLTLMSGSNAFVKSVRCDGIWWGLPLVMYGSKKCVLFEQRKSLGQNPSPPPSNAMEFNYFARAPGNYRVRIKYEAGSDAKMLLSSNGGASLIQLDKTLDQVNRPYASWEIEKNANELYKRDYSAAHGLRKQIYKDIAEGTKKYTKAELTKLLADNPYPKPFVYPQKSMKARDAFVKLSHGSNVISLSALNRMGPGTGVRIHGVTVEPSRGSPDSEMVFSNPPGLFLSAPVTFNWFWALLGTLLRNKLSYDDEKFWFMMSRIIREWIHLRRLLGIKTKTSISNAPPTSTAEEEIHTIQGLSSSSDSGITIIDQLISSLNLNSEEDLIDALEKSLGGHYYDQPAEKTASYRGLFSTMKPAVNRAKVTGNVLYKNGYAYTEDVQADNGAFYMSLQNIFSGKFNSVYIPTDAWQPFAYEPISTVESKEGLQLGMKYSDAILTHYDITDKIFKFLSKPHDLKKTKTESAASSTVNVNFIETAEELLELPTRKISSPQKISDAFNFERRSQPIKGSSRAKNPRLVLKALEALGLTVDHPEAFSEDWYVPTPFSTEAVMLDRITKNNNPAIKHFVANDVSQGVEITGGLQDVGIEPGLFHGANFRTQLQMMRFAAGVRIDEVDPFPRSPLPQNQYVAPWILQLMKSLTTKVGVAVYPEEVRIQTLRMSDDDLKIDIEDDAYYRTLSSTNNQANLNKKLTPDINQNGDLMYPYAAIGPLTVQPIMTSLDLVDIENMIIGIKRKLMDRKAYLGLGPGIEHFESALPFSLSPPVAWSFPLRKTLKEVDLLLKVNIQNVVLPAKDTTVLETQERRKSSLNVEAKIILDATLSSQRDLVGLIMGSLSTSPMPRFRSFATYIPPPSLNVMTNPDASINPDVRPVIVTVRCGEILVHDITDGISGLLEWIQARPKWLELIATKAPVHSEESVISAPNLFEKSDKGLNYIREDIQNLVSSTTFKKMPLSETLLYNHNLNLYKRGRNVIVNYSDKQALKDLSAVSEIIFGSNLDNSPIHAMRAELEDLMDEMILSSMIKDKLEGLRLSKSYNEDQLKNLDRRLKDTASKDAKSYRKNSILRLPMKPIRVGTTLIPSIIEPNSISAELNIKGRSNILYPLPVVHVENLIDSKDSCEDLKGSLMSEKQILMGKIVKLKLNLANLKTNLDTLKSRAQDTAPNTTPIKILESQIQQTETKITLKTGILTKIETQIHQVENIIETMNKKDTKDDHRNITLGRLERLPEVTFNPFANAPVVQSGLEDSMGTDGFDNWLRNLQATDPHARAIAMTNLEHFHGGANVIPSVSEEERSTDLLFDHYRMNLKAGAEGYLSFQPESYKIFQQAVVLQLRRYGRLLSTTDANWKVVNNNVKNAKDKQESKNLSPNEIIKSLEEDATKTLNRIFKYLPDEENENRSGAEEILDPTE